MKPPKVVVQAMGSPQVQLKVDELVAVLTQAVQAEASKQLQQARPGKTFRQLAEAWLETEAARYVEPRNEERHVAHLKALWQMTEAELTPKAARAALLSLLKPHGKLGPNSVNKARGTARRIIREAQVNGEWVGTNPFDVVPRVKETKPEHERVNISDCKSFLPHLRRDRFRMAMTMLFLGTRPGELVALQKSDVDLGRAEVVIRRSRSRNQTKTGQQRRVPIPDELLPILQEAVNESPSEYVFCGADGGKMRDDTKLARCLQDAFRRSGLVTGHLYVCSKKGCGFKETRPERKPSTCPTCSRRLLIYGVPRRVRFYDLRHSAATLHREAGCDPRVIQLVLGHAATNTTDDIYTHLSDRYVRLELNRLTLYREARGST